MNKLLFLIIGVFAHLCTSAQTLSDGEYLIKIFDTNKFFAIAGGAKNNGAQLIQWDKDYSAHFRFLVKHLGNDVYTLQALHSGKYLSTSGTPTAGAKLVQWDWKNQDNQKWTITQRNGIRGYTLASYQNNMRVVIQHFNSLVTPANGAYAFLQGDMNMRTMQLDFKKNEPDAAPASTNNNNSSLKPDAKLKKN